MTSSDLELGMKEHPEVPRPAEMNLRTWGIAFAQSISPTMEALEAASGDAPYILENEDLSPGYAWVVATVATADIRMRECLESLSEREARLEAIRAVPEAALCRPILSLSPNGSIELLDGGHRVAVFRERGRPTLEALIRCPLSFSRTAVAPN